MLKENLKEERINKWFEHFSSLFGKEPTLPNEMDEEDLPKEPKQTQYC